MKRITNVIMVVVIFITTTKAQLHDAQWVVSPNVSVLDFRNDTLANYSINKWMNIFLTSATICNEAGELLYYTNGVFVADKNGDTVLNAYGLSPCPYTDSWDHNGLNIPYGALFLPRPGDSRYYCLIHFSNDTLSNTRPGTLYCSVIDKLGNFGLGEMIEKNKIFCKGKFREGGMTACKHANGRDYWIIIGGSNSNTFNKFLLTPDSILGPYKQGIGPGYSLPYDLAYSTFSQDGNKYATVTNDGYVTVFDFDRCNGDLSNPLLIYNNASTNPETIPAKGGSGLAFSPNGRFLYVTARLTLNQYDLFSINIQDSSVIYEADSADFAQIHFIQLAPNGQLLASCWNGGVSYYHIVKRPDEKGDSCQFVDTGFVSLTINSDNMPNMINYKLGPLVGSGCDTLSTDIERDKLIEKLPRIQPNPANKYVYIEMPMQGNFTFDLINETGQLIERKQTRQVDIFNTEDLPNGVYFLNVNGGNSQRVIVQH